MRAIFIAAVVAVMIPSAAVARSGLIAKPSAHGVAETPGRPEAVFRKKGVTVSARVGHAAGAEKAGLALAPTQVLIFGNPKLGTPLMQSNRAIADRDPVFAKMARIPHKLTDTATKR